MKERNVTVTLEKAKEWFSSGNATLKEIAQHFGKYFGMLITEAKYADMVNFEIL